MPTTIERCYLDQGYALPEGLTWRMVAERRARWDVPAIFVPIAMLPAASTGAFHMSAACR